MVFLRLAFCHSERLPVILNEVKNLRDRSSSGKGGLLSGISLIRKYQFREIPGPNGCPSSGEAASYNENIRVYHSAETFQRLHFQPSVGAALCGRTGLRCIGAPTSCILYSMFSLKKSLLPALSETRHRVPLP